MKTNKLLTMMMGIATVATTACEKTDRSFSLLDAGSSFQQSASYVPKPIDVLWVVDNSGSMASSQSNLTDNFASFINGYEQKGYDFHMAVTGTDAWRAQHQANATNKLLLHRARPGAIKFTTNPLTYLVDSGVFIMNRETPNLTETFITNATQGISGTGDERAFASIKEFLDAAPNSDFRRADATLAIIIVSDEDDFSANTTAAVINDYYEESNDLPAELVPDPDPRAIYNLYQDSRLDSVESYKTYLDTLVGAGNYSVNMIGILDQDCKKTLNDSYSGRRIGRRYMQLADMTGGVKTSLCANFGESLELISEKTAELNGVFRLTREPVVDSIKVIVNGVEVPNSPSYGWTYDASTMEITFFPTEVIPNDGDNVQILFTPVRAAN